jgi:hypothetical protein
MKRALLYFLTVFLVAWAQQVAWAQSLEGTWLRTITLETECPSLPTVSEDFTDTVTYSEFDRTIELPEEYQNCTIEESGNRWTLECTYDQDVELCTYHFTLTGDGGLGEDEFDFQFTVEYTVSGAPACLLIPLCVIRGTIHGDRLLATSTEEEPTPAVDLAPATHHLFQNFPNPFNPSTAIRYQIAENDHPVKITLRVYNILGQEIAILVEEVNGSGVYTVTWDGKDGHEKIVTNGYYFCRLEVDEFRATRCMLLLK